MVKPYQISALPQGDQVAALPLREPYKIPATNEEPQYAYVFALKQSCPCEYLHICGLSFEKYILPLEAGWAENINKHFPTRYSTMMMTSRQAAYILDRAKLLIKFIPRRVITGGPDEQDRIEPEQNICASDYIVVCKASEFNPAQLGVQSEVQSPFIEKVDEVTEFQKALIKGPTDRLDAKKEEDDFPVEPKGRKEKK